MKSGNRGLAELLRTQYGTVAKAQLAAVHRGVYRSVAFPVTFEQRLMAAVLAAGRGAIASHVSASWLWGLLPRAPERPSVTVPPNRHPRIDGSDVYRLNDVDPMRVRHRQNFECTDPLRTLVDLAAVAPSEDVVAAVDKALSTRLVTVPGIESELDRRAARGRRGVRQLQSLLAERGMIGAPAPSVLESEILSLFARWRIPVQGREVYAGPDGRYRVDISLAYPVMVEVDGFAYHWTPEAKAHDEARRNELRLGGIFLLVYTWLDVRFEERRVGRETMAALNQYARGAAK